MTVSDSGEGVPDDFVARLFERFARADSHRTGEHKGTGLGLYISRRLAIANAGELGTTHRPDRAGRDVRRRPPPAAVPTVLTAGSLSAVRIPESR